MKARLPAGMGGGPQNMNQMLKQAQKMQEEITAKQNELEEREFEATVGGGAVEVKMTGAKKLLSIKIKPEAVDPDDVEMLEDLVMSAFNQAIENVEKTSEEEMGKITGGASFPGLF
ncbi:MAG: YbaB/EbfC family nucleoid-associated protein [Ruminococcus sp.]|nr:YbaB/EbfC family nucleoid-associated protein [Ruminococcus sp.]MCD7727884.1 YbaB/EbfC family nucleoid-associated protein [Ruminococcus sp.]